MTHPFRRLEALILLTTLAIGCSSALQPADGGPDGDHASGPPCRVDSDCTMSGAYCAHPTAGCDAPGVCFSRLGAECPAPWPGPTFCGCDGQAFGDDMCPGAPDRPWVQAGACGAGNACPDAIVDGSECAAPDRTVCLPTRVACACGPGRFGGCECGGGRWYCPQACDELDCAPDAGVRDAGDASPPPDATTMVTCSGDPPTGSCEAGQVCVTSSRCNPAMPVHCDCDTTSHTWQCEPHCI